MLLNAIKYYDFVEITVTDYGAPLSRDLRLLSKYASTLVCIVLICDKYLC